MITVVLIRHAESTWNREGRIQGKQDPPLSPQGRHQAQALAERLRHEPLAAVYSSPQQRARATAEVIAATHGLSVIVEPGLAEIDHGHWEGLTEPEVQERFAETFYLWQTRPGQVTMPGGEAPAAVQARVREVWHRILSHHDNELIALVSHEIPLRAIIADVLGLHLDLMKRFAIHNAALSVVEVSETGPRLLCLNDRCHLDGRACTAGGHTEYAVHGSYSSGISGD